jgi:maltose alpha-D-glucosyltransferase/alpha-amylase
LWKEEHTTCDNLPQVHTVVKFLRVAFDYVAPNTLVLAEANLQPSELVKYFGTGDECTAAYHFPLTAKVYQSMAIQSFAPIKDALSKESTPDIPSNCAWFFFLRCHDEMNLHLFNEEERKFMFNFYCHDEKWQFRKHTGISARVSDLLMYDENWIHMANSILLTACGTPIIYYGDEYAKKIDNEYYEERFRKTGIVDSRNYCRGRIAWASVDSELKDPNTLCYKVFNHLKRMLKVRTMYPWLGSTRTVQFVEIMDTLGRLLQNMLVFVRTNGKESLVFFHNLSDKPCDFVMPFRMLHFTGTDYTIFKQGEEATDLLGEPIIYVDEKQGVVRIKERGHLWLKKPVQEKSVYLC